MRKLSLLGCLGGRVLTLKQPPAQVTMHENLEAWRRGSLEEHQQAEQEPAPFLFMLFTLRRASGAQQVVLEHRAFRTATPVGPGRPLLAPLHVVVGNMARGASQLYKGFSASSTASGGAQDSSGPLQTAHGSLQDAVRRMETLVEHNLREQRRKAATSAALAAELAQARQADIREATKERRLRARLAAVGIGEDKSSDARDDARPGQAIKEKQPDTQSAVCSGATGGAVQPSPPFVSMVVEDSDSGDSHVFDDSDQSIACPDSPEWQTKPSQKTVKGAPTRPEGEPSKASGKRLRSLRR